MALTDPPRLGCGRSIDQVWAGMGKPPTGHEAQCEQCQAARARLQKLDDATRAMRETDEHDPRLTPRAGLSGTIMAVARAEVRRGKSLGLRTNQIGSTEISEQALGSLVRSAAAAVPGIHSRRCHIDIREEAPQPTGNTGSTGHGRGLVINLRVASAAGLDIPLTADELRHEISNAIAAFIGIEAAIINITVEDLYDA